MQRVLLFVLIPVATCALSQCGSNKHGKIVAATNGAACKHPAGKAGLNQNLSSVIEQGQVLIMQGDRRISVCRSTAPFIEETRWFDGQKNIVVKSRGRHGPATVQLFNSCSGEEIARVMAYDIRGGIPVWASGMED